MEHKTESINLQTQIVVVGAGISGLTAALEAAETGYDVVLIEKQPYVGGRVSQLFEYFPKLCPPTCGLEINLRRLKDNRKIKLLTLSTVKTVEKEENKYEVFVEQKPRYVNNKCTVCGDCVKVCPVQRPNDFNFGLDNTKAIYLPYNNAYPQKYVIDPKACLFEKCKMCVEVCKYDAIDLNEKPRLFKIEADAVVWATGWIPYDAKKLDNLGFGVYPNVITNMMMERLASPNGPTNGKIMIPNFDGELKEFAFVQCAGSRDENHLEYCSSVCCLASVKQATYIRNQIPDSIVHIFYIDLRANGILEDFIQKYQNDENIKFYRGKVGRVFQSQDGKRLIVESENTMTGEITRTEVDAVILATGMQPSISLEKFPVPEICDENWFIKRSNNGYIGCGVATAPKDVASSVQESTGAAMKAIMKIKEGK